MDENELKMLGAIVRDMTVADISGDMAKVMRFLLFEWAIMDEGNRRRDKNADVNQMAKKLAAEGAKSIHLRALGRPIPESPNGLQICKDLRDMLSVYIEACEESIGWCHPPEETF